VQIVWLISTTLVDRHRLAFFRFTKAEVQRLLERWPLMVNFVDARYTRSIEWLRRLGAEVGEPQPFGAAGLPFHPFVFARR
jgi:hypothetical protein